MKNTLLNSLPKQRKIRLFIFGILLVTFVTLTAYLSVKVFNSTKSSASVSGPKLSLSPSEKTISKVGETLSFDIELSTQGTKVTATNIVLTYDPAILDEPKFTNGLILPVKLSSPKIANGEIAFALGCKPETPFRGNGVVGKITFKVKSDVSTKIRFTSKTMVAEITQVDNALTEAIGVEISSSKPEGQLPSNAPPANITPEKLNLWRNLTLYFGEIPDKFRYLFE